MPPRVALIAHDDEKAEMIEFVTEHEALLSEFELLGTGTTGERIEAEAGIPIERKRSGPLGGDAQIAGEVAEGKIDAIIFLRDPLTAQPHEPDIGALLRLCDVHDVPLATTRASAKYIIEGLARAEDVTE